MNKDKKIESLAESYVFELNDSMNRKKFAREVSEIMEFEVVDTTTDEIIDEGFVRCEGLNPKTKKIFIVTINSF